MRSEAVWDAMHVVMEKLLEDNKVYMGNQIQISGTSRCYGIVADEEYLLVCEYGCDGTDPQIVVYKRREKLS